MGRKVDVQSLERKALLISLPVVVGGSILANLLAWDVKWQIPLIFAALYIVLSLLMEIRDNQKPRCGLPPDLRGAVGRALPR